jgi:helicase
MRSFLDDLRHAPTPLALSSRSETASAAKNSCLALIESAMSGSSELTEGNSLAAQGLRRYAIWLEDIAMEGDVDEGDFGSTVNVAATIYEFLGRAGLGRGIRSVFEPPLNDLLRAAILGSIGPYRAQPSVIARRIKEAISGISPSSSVDRVHSSIASVLVLLLGREFHMCFSSTLAVRGILADALNELRERDAYNTEYFRLDRAVALSEACGLAATGMMVGAPDLLVQSAERLEQLANVAIDTEDELNFWLARRLRTVVQAMHGSSRHRVLHERRMPIEFRRALARDGFFELWQPQLEAIEKGLLVADDPPNFIVSIPTGAGKTLIAELAILQALKGESGGWAAYVTPSRALVNQVSSDLRRRLEDCGVAVRTVLAGAEQSSLMDLELELLTAGNSVTVTTPEKLDAYYRNARAAFDSCKLVIFDEAHKIQDSDRGPLLESLITRFVFLQPSTRIVLLSGVLSNHEDIVDWLGEERTQSIVMKRRPSRQIRGLAVRSNLEPQADRHSSRGRLRRVNFSGGLVLIHEREDLGHEIDVSLPNVFNGYFTERQYPRGWREDRKANHSTRNAHAISIAESLLKMPGSTLVFVQTTEQAEKSCRDLVVPSTADHEAERGQLADFLASELGNDHELVAQCRLGKAFHHSRLPASVQRGVELGLEQGWLRAVFSTPTLREGLNTAATNVILAGNTYWDDGLVDVDEADFENLAGRAGRPFRELEGLAILVPDSLATAYAYDAAGRYLLVGEEALRTRSQLSQLADWLSRSGGNLRSLSPGQQSLLLGLKAAGLDDADQLTNFFDQSLWSVQEENEQRIELAAKTSALAFRQAAESFGQERFALAARTGLSLTSVEALVAALEPEAHQFSKSLLQTPLRSTIGPLLKGALQLEEVRKGYLQRDVDWSNHLEPVLTWISGAPYDELLSTAMSSGVLAVGSDIGDAVKYAADVSTWFSWAIGAAYMILESVVEDVDTTIGTYPLLVKYGLPSTAAAYISLLGVADRSAAKILGDKFTDTGRTASIDQVSDWMSEIDDELDDLLPQRGLKSELVRRQAFRSRRAPLPYMFTRVSGRGGVPLGQVLALRVDDEGNMTGFVDDEDLVRFLDPESLLSFGQGSLVGLAAVLTSPIVRAGAAAVVIRLAALDRA